MRTRRVEDSARLKTEGESPSCSSTPPSRPQKSSGKAFLVPRFSQCARQVTLAGSALERSLFAYETRERILTIAGWER